MKIRVAHITTIDMSLRYLLLEQMRSLQEAGYEVVGISTPGRDTQAVVDAGIRHIPVTITRRLSPFQDLISLWRLYRIMRREKFTIVHTHNPKPGLLGQLAARFARVPIVVNTLHGFYFHDHMSSNGRRFYITMEKIAALCSDIILSQNAEDIQTALKEGICKPDKIKHLGNGIDLTEFDPNRFSPEEIQKKREAVGIPDGVQVVGFVGRLAARRKGFIDFLAAGQKIIEKVPDVRFLIIGDSDPGKPDAVDPSAAKDYGIDEHCIFLGWQPNTELPILYRLMNVLVLPSLFEGIPRVIMESSAMGIPSVATDVKGNREAVEPGRNGLLVPFQDVPGLAGAIVELLTQPEKARQMGEEGKRVAAERFDERLVFEKVKAEYLRLLGEKGFDIPAPQST